MPIHDPVERAHWLAFARLSGLGPRSLLAIREAFGDMQTAWKQPEAALRALGIRQADAIFARRAGLDPLAIAAGDAAIGAHVHLIDDPDYPEALRELPDPPPVLWRMGAWPLPDRLVAVVGMRMASPYGRRLAHQIGCDLATAGVGVVSGVAAGIDRAAHEGALAAKPTGRPDPMQACDATEAAPPPCLTIGVLGCGFRHVYPPSNRALYRAIAQAGTLLTEFPPEVPPLKGAFPRRNRLIAALGKGVVVVEAKRQSGSAITVDHALDLGREVFAVPGPVGVLGSEGPHAMIREGAALAESAADILRVLGWEAPPKPGKAHPPADSPAGRALAALGPLPLPLDTVLATSGLDVATGGAALMGLAIQQLAKQAPGGLWMLA